MLTVVGSLFFVAILLFAAYVIFRVVNGTKNSIGSKEPLVFTETEITNRYLDAGADFGDAVSQIYMGECHGFEKLLAEWEKFEVAYAELGFRTLSVDDFVEVGGWGKDPTSFGFRIRRNPGEDAVFHARYYRENYLARNSQENVVARVFESGKPVYGTYEIPSTDFLKKS